MLSGGFGLVFFARVEKIEALLVLTLVTSVFISVSYILIESRMLELINRLKDDENYLIGLRGFATDIGYLIGPILAGILASIFGLIGSFTWLGVLVVVATIAIYLTSPRIIRLPLKDIAMEEAKTSSN